MVLLQNLGKRLFFENLFVSFKTQLKGGSLYLGKLPPFLSEKGASKTLSH